MSTDPRFSQFAARAVFDDRLTPTDIRVLAVFGTRSNQQGWCYGNQKKIAAKIGVKRPTVNASIKKLVAFGYLACIGRKDKESGARITSVYRVLLDTPGAAPLDDIFEDIPPVIEADMVCQKEEQGRSAPEADAQRSQDIAPVIDADVPPSAQTDSPLSAQTDNINVPTNERVVVLVDWAARLREAQDRADPALNMTVGAAHTYAVLRGLCEPTAGEPCDWDLDVLPAIDELAGSFKAKRQQFRSWVIIKEAALRNRDMRLNGNREREEVGNAEPAKPSRRNDPNENRRAQHRSMARVLEARKLERELLDGNPRRITKGAAPNA